MKIHHYILMAALIISSSMLPVKPVHASSPFSKNDIAYQTTYDLADSKEGSVAVGAKMTVSESDFDDSDYTYAWSTNSNHVALIDNNKSTLHLSGKSVGEAVLTLTVTANNSDNDYDYDEETDEFGETIEPTEPPAPEVHTYQFKVHVTSPKLKVSAPTPITDDRIEGLGEIYYNYDYAKGTYQVKNTSSTNALAIISGHKNDGYDLGYNSYMIYQPGTYTIYVLADGRVLSKKIQVKKLAYKGDLQSTIIQKGSKKRIKTSLSQAVIKASNKRLVKKGKYFIARRNGKVKVTASYHGGKITRDYWVVPKNVKKAMNQAFRYYHAKLTYSNAKRMKKGYVDCSSFSWRSLAAGKIYVGNKRFAPTAADMAQSLHKKGRLITRKIKNTSSLKPADLIFSKGGNNHRYKNIYHAQLYVSNGYTIQTSTHSPNGGAIGFRNFGLNEKFDQHAFEVGRPVHY